VLRNRMKDKNLPDKRGTLHYYEGDVNIPITGGHRLVINVCNDDGSNFNMAISKKWPQAEIEYKNWQQSFKKNSFKLGEIQEILVEPNISVINIIIQHGISSDKKGNPPIRYDALETCLIKVAKVAKSLKGSVHMSRITGVIIGIVDDEDNLINAGIECTSWNKIERIIINTITSKDIDITIYDQVKTI
jgi:hypothetical protein